MGGTCTTQGNMRNEYNLLVGKPKRKILQINLGVGGRIILK
jgi:hypothetical protein